MEPIDIINYWYSDEIQKYWFSSTKEIDIQIKNKYEKIWQQANVGYYDNWMNKADGCLALIIIFDQFPLNMYRGKKASFKTEKKAIEITLHALKKGFDKDIEQKKLIFLFMPLMHSENLEHQNLAIKLFEKYKLMKNLEFAKHHKNIIKKFGRFPHRNLILKRESTKQEIEYLKSEQAFNG
jgi:uncharacterized protein (DUF924 family)